MDILCFSHLRWDFVFQRPQHIMTRFGASGHVHFWEEPRFNDEGEPSLQRSSRAEGVTVLTPLLPAKASGKQAIRLERDLLEAYLAEEALSSFVAWYYTPMALSFSNGIHPQVTVYDCMDELSAFQGAPPELVQQEQLLFKKADLVFAGGASLFASKRTQHPYVFSFPSSIDREHFAMARRALPEPLDQLSIPHPRIGFFGVLDERLDRDLLQKVVEARPEWHLVLVGPVVKIDEKDLPRAANIHYLGQKTYATLPDYLAGWDVAMLPFARNHSTRFISPTKTPEYLAGGKPVVSTPIRDVVSPYGECGLVEIAGTAAEFVAAIERCLRAPAEDWLPKVDDFLAQNSWDLTFDGMRSEIQKVLLEKQMLAEMPAATTERSSRSCSTI